MAKEYYNIRLDDKTVLVTLPPINGGMSLHDAKLYVSLLTTNNQDWRLPNRWEGEKIQSTFNNPAFYLLIINNADNQPQVLFDEKNNFEIGIVIPVCTKYHPTIIRRFLTWLKNTTVANIVRKS
jgi:hypothetical protein